MTHDVLNAQEAERRRISREIHDALGQQMTALRMSLETLRLRAEKYADLDDALSRMEKLAQDLDRSIELLVCQFRPSGLEALTLSDALRALVTDWADRFGLGARFELLSQEPDRLPLHIESHLYRIAQEALHNVVKHARATAALVRLERRDGQAWLLIQDNGCGFEPTTVSGAHQGIGLSSMRERAAMAGGDLTIASRPNGGTTIHVRVPAPRVPTKAAAMPTS